MNNPDLVLAREWAKREIVSTEGQLDAAERVIMSLPDHWIDTEKVRELAGGMANWSLPDGPSTTEIDYRRLIEIMDGFTGRINDLLAPPLPTLAELIEAGNDPQKYQWMQCNVEGRGDDTFVIAVVGERVNKVLLPDGLHEVKGNNQVTPLPDLPKLEWPAQVLRNPENPPAETLNNPSSDTPRNPRPEDVPAGEPWLILCNGHEWVGTRDSRDGANYPWSLSRLDGIKITSSKDLDITLVSRLVPEVQS